jgi:hypothetical protein
MLRSVAIVALMLILTSTVMADVYMHNPRGSNNRNRGGGTNTANANRLFDSQNNNNGGYCWGPPMTYYENSLLQVEWTAQHGCGAGHSKVDCDIILQYMCHPLLRDGLETDTITADNMDQMDLDPKTGEQAYMYGMHEPYEYFDACRQRTRNTGLFLADQNLNAQQKALKTRQDTGGTPHGFECTEERDYYPYWHPSPWRDIAVLTSEEGRCDYFKSESQNVKGKNLCSVPEHNNEGACKNNGGEWEYHEPWGMEAPECIVNGFSRVNHLGNTKTGFTNGYNWVIPRLDVMSSEYINPSGKDANCVLRIRYNISTSDAAGWRHVDSNGGEDMLDYRSNGESSPVKGDPYKPYGTDAQGNEKMLSIALNTDQYGRTFQDRSHMFYISKRPDGVSDLQRIINLNVRGKRGNIVQAYPAVEYDFVPNNLLVNVGDLVHFQWTGCDTNPNYAGEGRQNTDRSNIVQLKGGRYNLPMKFGEQTLFDDEKAYQLAHLDQYGGRVCDDVEDQECCLTRDQLQNVDNQDQDVRNCFKLNDPSRAYFDGGLVEMSTAGTYHYMSTRNNNFTNRSQKGSITVGALLPTWGIIVASFGAAAFVGAGVLAGGSYFAQTHPESGVANLFANVRV